MREQYENNASQRAPHGAWVRPWQFFSRIEYIVGDLAALNEPVTQHREVGVVLSGLTNDYSLVEFQAMRKAQAISCGPRDHDEKPLRERSIDLGQQGTGSQAPQPSAAETHSHELPYIVQLIGLRRLEKAGEVASTKINMRWFG